MARKSWSTPAASQRHLKRIQTCGVVNTGTVALTIVHVSEVEPAVRVHRHVVERVELASVKVVEKHCRAGSAAFDAETLYPPVVLYGSTGFM